MRVNLVLLAAIGAAEAQTTVQPELTTPYDSIFEVDFEGAENEPDQVITPHRETYRGRDEENPNNRRARLAIEKAHREREKQEGHQRPVNGRMMGRFPSSAFGGRLRVPPSSSGFGGRLGGFGSAFTPAGAESKPSEDPETNQEERTTTTTTEAPPTATAPNELFKILATKKTTTTRTTTTTKPPTTTKPFWVKKDNKETFHGERSRSDFIDNVTKYMGILPRNSNSNRCLECKNSFKPEECLQTGKVKSCTKNEACQTEIRWENGKTRIVSSCKQYNACKVMTGQNRRCHKYKGTDKNRTCWKCCKGDLCNIADMAPFNFE